MSNGFGFRLVGNGGRLGNGEAIIFKMKRLVVQSGSDPLNLYVETRC